MRVLWISTYGGGYKSDVIKGTGGWVGALQKELNIMVPELQLAIAFPHNEDNDLVKCGNVSYYPIRQKVLSVVDKIKVRLHVFDRKGRYVSRLLQIVEEYNPDIIHVWGVENFYSAVIPHIKNIPLVVHIQGFSSACMNAYLPPAISENDVRLSNGLLKRILKQSESDNHYRDFQLRAKNEIIISKYVKNWIGRTEWDYEMSRMLSPGSRYFHCDELMRDEFDDSEWNYQYDGKVLKIMSTISCNWYKGVDLVLKTALLLKEQGITISWKIFGWNKEHAILDTLIRKLGITPESVNVHMKGCVDARTIKAGLLCTDMYVHPSYIENSSNAIAEAMLLGVPVVAQNVGGNSTILNNGSGILVPSNEPYVLAYKIMSLRDKQLAEHYSKRAMEIARKRHDKDKIVKDLLGIYEKMIIQDTDME